MAPLVWIGFFALCAIALLITTAFSQMLISEIAFEGRPGVGSLFFGFISACLWGLVWIFAPFTIVISKAIS